MDKIETKFSWRYFFMPTPRKFKKLGFLLLWIFSTVSVIAVLMEDKKIAIAAVVCGVIGKTLTTFVTYK